MESAIALPFLIASTMRQKADRARELERSAGPVESNHPDKFISKVTNLYRFELKTLTPGCFRTKNQELPG